MNKNYIYALATTALTSIAYDPSGAGWKTDDNGVVVMQDGNPVFVDANGEERTIAISAISNLTGEVKQLRSRAQTAEAALKAFEGLDAEAARKAIETVGKIKEGDLINAGKVDEVRAEIESKYAGKLSELQSALDDSTGRMRKMIVDNAFNSSEFVRDRVAIPADLIATAFRDNFKIENDTLVPYGPDGKIIYSEKNIGQVATFDEALSIMIGSRSDKDKLLLAKPRSGTGNSGEGGNRGDGRVVTRSEYDSKSPMEQAQIAAQVREGKVKLVD